MIWVQIYQYLGPSYFVVSWAILGIVIYLAYVGFVSLLIVQMTQVKYKLTRHVEYAKSTFDNPRDPKSEENFRQECSKFIIPYLHAPLVFPSGITGVFRAIGLLRRIFLGFLQIVLHFYVSYSIVVLLVTNQLFLNQVWTHVSSNIPYLPEITVAFLPFFQNPIPSTALVFLLSLYSLISPARRGYITYSDLVCDVLCDWFSIFSRFLYAALLISFPWIIETKNRTLKYEPFTFPTDLTLIIQKAIKNIENKECNVTKWTYLVKDERDIDTLKYMIYTQEDIPFFVRIMCQQADSRLALKKINESNPILYLGTIDNRCAVIGTIEYDSYEKIFSGVFSFDNLHVKKYFKSIAEIEINDQKKLKRPLPNNLKDLICKLKLGEEK